MARSGRAVSDDVGVCRRRPSMNKYAAGVAWTTQRSRTEYMDNLSYDK